jgi:hypothetical protein
MTAARPLPASGDDAVRAELLRQAVRHERTADELDRQAAFAGSPADGTRLHQRAVHRRRLAARLREHLAGAPA